MKVSCPACDSKYTIADEKVAGRKVKVRCKSCGGQILINGTVPPPPPDPNQATESTDDDATRIYKGGEIKALTGSELSVKDTAAKDTSDDAPASKSAPNSSAEPGDDGVVWSVNVSDTDERSLKTHEVVAGYLSGEFAGEVYVWRDGMDDWTSIPDAPDLAEAIEAAKKQATGSGATGAATAAKAKALPSAGKGTKTAETPAPADAAAGASKKQAARAAGAKRPQSAHDLFAAASAAGSEMDVSVSESEPAQKMTGARNENSVLFSLDALKAGITAAPTGQAPKGKQPPASPRKKLEDLVAGGPSLAGGPGASALTLNASQALLMAPAPPPPPPKPEPVIVPSVAPAAAVPLTPKKKLGLVVGLVGAIVAAGVVAGVTVALMTKQQPAPAVSVVAVPVPVASSPVAATPTPAAEPKPAETTAQAETKPAESSTSTGSAAPTKVASGGPAGAKPGAAAVAPPAGVGAKTETKKPDKKEEPAAPAAASGAGGFSKEAAAQALSVAASQTSICKKPDGPTGQGKVQVTFAPSGRATTANIISGPFGGTAVGGCVSGVFKRAKVPAFSGDPVTVSKSFTISP